MSYLLYTFFALVPSFVWLLFFLGKDKNPESKIMILKIFGLGGFIALVAGYVQIGIFSTLNMLSIENFLFPIILIIINHFFIIAFSEEFLKYVVVEISVLKNSEFDEPVDAMIYMIVAALGFAAVENFLYITSSRDLFHSLTNLEYVYLFSAIRFIGATFLHALASGLIGFFLALSIYKGKGGWKLLSLGIIIATALHGFFNLFIIKSEESFYYAYIPVAIIISLFIFNSLAFNKIKKIKSICKT